MLLFSLSHDFVKSFFFFALPSRYYIYLDSKIPRFSFIIFFIQKSQNVTQAFTQSYYASVTRNGSSPLSSIENNIFSFISNLNSITFQLISLLQFQPSINCLQNNILYFLKFQIIIITYTYNVYAVIYEYCIFSDILVVCSFPL